MQRQKVVSATFFGRFLAYASLAQYRGRETEGDRQDSSQSDTNCYTILTVDLLLDLQHTMDDTQPWAFNHLNQLSPQTGPSPTNGTSSSQNRTDLSLSYPINSEALQRQLEAWTNIEFDFDQPVDFGLLPLDEYKGSEEITLGGSLYGNGQNAYGMSPSGRDVLDYGLGSIGLGLETTERTTGQVDRQNDSSLTNFGLPLVLPTLLPPSSTSSTSIPTIPNFDLPVVLPPPTNLSTPAKASNPKKRKQSISASASTSTDPSEGNEELDSFPALVLGLDEEANGIAVEEDKRRRNTAASGELGFVA